MSIPTDYPNLLFWYDFASGQQYTDAGITLATGSGQLVQQWNDLSGNGNHATQTSGSKTAVDTNEQALHFISGSHFVLPDVWNIAGATEGELWFVLRVQYNTGPARGFCNFNTSDLRSHYVNGPDSGIYDNSLCTIRNNVGVPYKTNRWNIYNTVSATDYWEAYFNGGLIYKRFSNTFQSNNTSPKIGISADGFVFDGWMRQVFAFTQKLTSAQRQELTRSLLPSVMANQFKSRAENSSTGSFIAIKRPWVEEPYAVATVAPFTSSIVPMTHKQYDNLTATYAISAMTSSNNTIRNQSFIPVSQPLEFSISGLRIETMPATRATIIISRSIQISSSIVTPHPPLAGQLFPIG